MFIARNYLSPRVLYPTLAVNVLYFGYLYEHPSDHYIYGRSALACPDSIGSYQYTVHAGGEDQQRDESQSSSSQLMLFSVFDFRCLLAGVWCTWTHGPHEGYLPGGKLLFFLAPAAVTTATTTLLQHCGSRGACRRRYE